MIQKHPMETSIANTETPKRTMPLPPAESWNSMLKSGDGSERDRAISRRGWVMEYLLLAVSGIHRMADVFTSLMDDLSTRADRGKSEAPSRVG